MCFKCCRLVVTYTLMENKGVKCLYLDGMIRTKFDGMEYITFNKLKILHLVYLHAI